MGKVVAFINEKGGIGKTSLNFNSAWYLAEQGKKILMVDLDGQRANLTFFAGVAKSESLTTMYNVLVDGVEPKLSIIPVEKNLFIIPATDNVISLNEKNASLQRMKDVMNEIKDEFDYIFIDVSPTPNRSHALALSASDSCVIPMLADVTCLAANMGVAESILLVQESINPDLKVAGIVFNRYNWRSSFSKEVHDTTKRMAESLDSKIFKTKIRKNIAMEKNVGNHEGVTAYDRKSNAAEDIISFCKELEREVMK